MAHRTSHLHRHSHLHHRHAAPLPAGSGSQTIPDAPSLIQRTAATCGPDGTSSCETPADGQATSRVIIGVSVAVPLTLALVVLFFLHRRIKRKQRLEDATDKHKSLDFGLDAVHGQVRKGRKGKPEMTINTHATDLSGRRNRGMSMDMDFANPYMLPAGLNGSRESLHSMSRSLTDKHDPYRPVAFARSETNSRSPSRIRNDNGSVYTGNSNRSTDKEKAALLSHAARMANDSAMNSPEGSRKNSNVDGNRPLPRLPRKASLAVGRDDNRWLPADDPRSASSSPPDLSGAKVETPKDMISSSPLPNFPLPTAHALPQPPPSHEAERRGSSRTPPQGDALGINVPAPTYDRSSGPRPSHALPAVPDELPRAAPVESALPPLPSHYSEPQNDNLTLPDFDPRRASVMGMRPLPPDDLTDNPEQRANRIRSFYKEYFDESKPNPAGYYPDPYGEVDDYQADYLQDGAIYDPNTGTFFYASQPQKPDFDIDGRRAMTPPPRAPPQFMHGHRHVMSTQSAGRPRMPPKRQLPPPRALQGLPTPHLLKDDLGALVDFAPPTTFRQRQNGQMPDSPRGVARPYSPAFRAHTPINSSFDDLAVMPSPHALRKSGTFTALDFAPPPRFRERGESMSETGSIRSNRSGVSSRTQYAIRTGAYRLSRLPKNQVGSAADLQQSLRPSWDIGRK